jgi:CTP synthase
MTKFIFITGGVVSSLGKGITASSLAALLQCHGYKVRLRKLDPYLNIDPGTMSPNQHGEVFVTEDGSETDLDLGHYERFSGINAQKGDNTTAGQIYLDLLTKERRGDYLGETVQVIPHVTELIKKFILNNTENEDFVICEIGGTVGDIEAEPFVESIRQLSNDLGHHNTLFIHLTLIPYLKASKEIKTKPTQHSVRELTSRGIQPQILICRTEKHLHPEDRQKIALFCNVPTSSVLEGFDQDNIYKVILNYHEQGLDKAVLKHFGLKVTDADISRWQTFIDKLVNPKTTINIAMIYKYETLKDSYKSLIEAFTHAGVANDAKVNLTWISASSLKDDTIDAKLKDASGIIIPGGFGERGIKGKMLAIKYARENNIPFLGICLGMQLACIEFASNVLAIENANSTEFDPNCTKIVARMNEWVKGDDVLTRKHDADFGGTMRLGSYPCKITKDSLAYDIYNSQEIFERHRHRYEVNIEYRQAFAAKGLVFSGLSPDGKLPEILELQSHPFFVAVQYHPELKSKPFDPHPLFKAFVHAAICYTESK